MINPACDKLESASQIKRYLIKFKYLQTVDKVYKPILIK